MKKNDLAAADSLQKGERFYFEEGKMNYFDCHADTLTVIEKEGETLWKNSCDLDLERTLRFTEKYTQIFAIWKDAKKSETGYPETTFAQQYQKAVSILEKEKEHICLCKSGQDMVNAHKDKKGAAFLSIEDISVMGKDAYRAKELGFSFALLTWNYENLYGCGAVSGQEKGLTQEGKNLAKELLRQRVVLDISHLSDQGAEDILLLTDAPVIASHSNVREICPHPRNLKREQIQELIRRRGLIGINFFASFVGENPVMDDLIRHMDQILEMGGEDVLALGTDFDGCGGEFPHGICDVQSVLAFRDYMEQRGFSKKLLDKIFFDNGYRFVLENL